MENQIELFHFEPNKRSFESFSQENGIKFWYGSDFAVMLGYESLEGFRKAINRAMVACNTLNIPIDEHFISIKRDVNGKQVSDYKLTRFACYLTAMNGDVKKQQVAQAQAYFITISEACLKYVQAQDGVERVVIRSELADHEKSLSSTAFNAKIENFAFFQNKGYRGLYNMSLKDIKVKKGIPSERSPLDFMGKQELAANLFRITQTEAKIINENITGQTSLENTAFKVGQEVRNAIKKINGQMPEDLAAAEDIRNAKKGLKGTQKESCHYWRYNNPIHLPLAK
jgi:DNA-damage-inducible protein D